MDLKKINLRIIVCVVFLTTAGISTHTYAANDIRFKLGSNDFVQTEGDDYGSQINPSALFSDIVSQIDEVNDDDGAEISFKFSEPELEGRERIIIFEPEDKGTRKVRFYEPYSYEMDVDASFYFYHDVWPEGSGTGLTFTGNQCIPWYTVAVDPEVIPLGSKIIINGREYLADDTGGAIQGNKIDIAVWSRDEAFRYGRRWLHIKVIPPGGGGAYKIVEIPAEKAADIGYVKSFGVDAEVIDD